MTQGFQQQGASTGFCIPKSAPAPQHGQKTVPAHAKARETRSFDPKPGR